MWQLSLLETLCTVIWPLTQLWFCLKVQKKIQTRTEAAAIDLEDREEIDVSSRKLALVTGGGSGLGRVLALEFANAGAEVHVCGRRREPLDDLASNYKNILAHQLDVTDEDGTEAMFNAIGDVEIVIANAGAADSAPLHRTSTELWHRMIAVNLTGCF